MRKRSRNGHVGNKDSHSRQWQDGSGKDEAIVYQAHRSMPEGRVTTLKKRQKFLNIYGVAAELPESERRRHIHPRRLRG